MHQDMEMIVSIIESIKQAPSFFKDNTPKKIKNETCTNLLHCRYPAELFYFQSSSIKAFVQKR
ncbi:hypothetical protein N473_08490 [Pseudoalteromonas luteoviolacea CPMOR-1]|uniref:Uncharacterized protein n=1 Tax=Pseudoalteromonas luteoviolacea CPMOR-1 TaxID=1365248 RepID=A0A161YUW9_9GAMM|nr:hypothetical protein N473_08490 [Pseudoalteromonas luteoviolacea CPMOR-1]